MHLSITTGKGVLKSLPYISGLKKICRGKTKVKLIGLFDIMTPTMPID